MSSNITNRYPHLSMMKHVKPILSLNEGQGLTFKFPSHYGEDFHVQVFFTGTTILVGYQLSEKWDYHIRYQEQKTQFEGKRVWFICPIKGCKKRVDKLYLKEELFACRKCHKLLYPSQNRSKYFLPMYKLERLEKKLKGKGRWGSPPPRPLGMHWETYERLAKEYADVYCEIMEKGEANIAAHGQSKTPKPTQNTDNI